MSWTMPSETAPQDRIWMAFPPLGSTVTETQESADEARATWAAVAHAALEFESVTMVVDPADVSAAQRVLSADIEIVEAPLDDAWMRDIGPTFVHDTTGQIAAVDWVFNGWGQQDWAEWGNDSRIARIVAEHADVEIIDSQLVNEGGGIHVNGSGTVLVTQTVQLDPGRNPSLTRNDVEHELTRTIGATNVIWLPRGLWRDSERFGTRGHVDIVATISSPGVILLHAQPDPEHPDHLIMRDVRRAIEESRTETGAPWTIIEVPGPTELRDEEGWVDHSYINHLVVNGGVIASSFGDARDDQAKAILAEAYPERRIVQVESRPLFSRGGGIHCVTQQQPSHRA